VLLAVAESFGHQGEVGIGSDQTFGAGERAGSNPVGLFASINYLECRSPP
jgi:hypothetical protein